jgi:hypothetical protein
MVGEEHTSICMGRLEFTARNEIAATNEIGGGSFAAPHSLSYVAWLVQLDAGGHTLPLDMLRSACFIGLYFCRWTSSPRGFVQRSPYVNP